MRLPLLLTCSVTVASCDASRAPSPGTPIAVGQTSYWCDSIPRPVNQTFPARDVDSDWYDVRDVGDGVLAITEPRQFQEAISYLILGRERALLFDTGLGMVPIRPVVERLTRLPVVVINSHTHYDHVGGNAEFDAVLAVDTPYTRANQAGFPHAELVGEVARESFCGDAGRQVDTAAFRTPPWRSTGTIADGDSIDLGGRVLTVWRVPGHTPDAVVLHDRERGLLFTGDSYYDGTLWLYVPETDLDAYDSSMTRLSRLGNVWRLLPAHNTVTSEPGQIARALGAVRRVRAGGETGEAQSNGRLVFQVDGIRILTSGALLGGRRGDQTRGGSGLTVWE